MPDLDLSEIDAHARAGGSVCSIGALFEKNSPLDEPGQQLLRAALGSDRPSAWIARWLSDGRGIRMRGQTVSRHRAKECACDRA